MDDAAREPVTDASHAVAKRSGVTWSVGAARRRWKGGDPFTLLWLVVPCLLAAREATACTVCFGDPDSALTHGARWGIVTMLLVTYGLLVGMAAMLGFVMVRAHRRHRIQTEGKGDPQPG